MATLDPHLTFENFVVGPANRLAAAAARRAAERPGVSYNPLFIYAPRGLGKTHLLGAIAWHASKVSPGTAIHFETSQEFLSHVVGNQEGEGDEAVRERYRDVDILLLDDVQFLTAESHVQDILLLTLDALAREGKQVVLTSDRPPADIQGLAAHLRSRFESGLLVTMGPPEYETRVAIIQKVAETYHHVLGPDVPDAIGGIPYRSVSEILNAVDRILGIQDARDRTLTAEEVTGFLQETDESLAEEDRELGQFLEELSHTVADQVRAREEPWRKRVREVVEKAEVEGFRGGQLRRWLDRSSEPPELDDLVEEFQGGLARLQEIGRELDAVGNPWPEAAYTLLKDPERLDDAEALLASARERARPFPPIPPGPDLEGLKGRLPKLVVRSAHQLVTTERPEYTPLYAWSPMGTAARLLLHASARSAMVGDTPRRVALTSAGVFADEFITALSQGVAGAWRERWWAADVLMVQDVEAFAEFERAQEELFHLMETLLRRKARIMVTGSAPLEDLDRLDERILARLQDGLVLQVPVEEGSLDRELRESLPDGLDLVEAGTPRGSTVVEEDREWIKSFKPRVVSPPGRRDEEGTEVSPAAVLDSVTSWGTLPPEADPWVPSPEEVFWEWPRIEDRLVEELD